MSIRIAKSTLLVICTLGLQASVLGQKTEYSLQSNSQLLKAKIVLARKHGEMAEAEALTTELAQLVLDESGSLTLADVYFQKARNAMERNLYPVAQLQLTQAISLYQVQDNQLGLANAYRQLGLTYRYQANYSQALEYIYLAMQINQQEAQTKAIASTYNSLGLVLEKMGLFQGAAQAHQSSLELNYQLDDKDGIASDLYNLGDIHRVMGDHQLALSYFHDALKIDIESDDKKYIAYSNNKIGYQQIELGNFKKAREHLNTSLTLFKLIETPRDTDWALTSMATLEMREGHFVKARQILDGVIQRAIENQYESLLVDAYRISAELAYIKGETDLAIAHIDAGIIKAKINNEAHDESLFEALRVKVYLKQDELQHAFDALLAQKKLDDELLNTTRIKTIATVQSQTEFVRRAQQIKLLEKEKALNQARLKQAQLNRNVWLASMVIGVIMLALIYGRFSQRRLNKRLREEVTLRTQELNYKNVELQAAYQEMEAISLTDKLTGIHNRRFLENHIESDIEKSQRVYNDWRDGKAPKPQQSDVVIFMIDVDHFKRVNDEYGHSAGDEVLKQLTRRLALVFRQSDYLVRWGGEEFVGVARFIDRADAPLLAQRLLKEVSSTPFTISEGVTTFHTCSIGYVCYPPRLEHDQSKDWQTLIALADCCLYHAKNNGRNAWVGIESINETTFNLVELCNKHFGSGSATDKITVRSSLLQS
ncbi:MAG: diguanylate cyclase [Paraglaciecola polaris]|uniref:tetratricopeptide repeat-containing diguanylate cyclase n=1 Tax=Paraglaciecola polaris TaxID=222814 RepID=UPI003002823D